MKLRLNAIIITLFTAMLFGCAAPEQSAELTDRSEGIDLEAAKMTERDLNALSEAELAELKRKYPVLRQERAPEPEPSADARPVNVPAEVRQALTEGVLESIRGEATFYADRFEGSRTASGIPFRQNQMVAAHRNYPFGTLLRVTNERNGKQVNVRVVDRGPHGTTAARRGTILDLSRRAAEQLDFISAGRTPIRVEVLEWGEGLPTG